MMQLCLLSPGETGEIAEMRKQSVQRRCRCGGDVDLCEFGDDCRCEGAPARGKRLP